MDGQYGGISIIILKQIIFYYQYIFIKIYQMYARSHVRKIKLELTGLHSCDKNDEVNEVTKKTSLKMTF